MFLSCGHTWTIWTAFGRCVHVCFNGTLERYFITTFSVEFQSISLISLFILKKKKKQNNSKSQPSQTPNIIGVAFRYLNKIFLIVFFTSTCLIKLLCICKIPDVWKLEIVSTKINLYQDFCNLAFHLHSLVVSYWLWLWYNYA